MSKIDYLSRHLSIIRRLQKSPATFNQIKDCVASNADIAGNKVSFSNRTFQRDIADILSLYQISIEYDFSAKVYTISDSHQDEISTRVLESLEMFNALKVSSGIAPYVHFERRRPLGSEHFTFLVQAIKQKTVIELSYQKFWEDKPRTRFVNPLALKESRGRWYLIAASNPGGHIRTFGLDRIKGITVTAKKFNSKEPFDISAWFGGSFGIIRPDDSSPRQVILSCEREYGQYLRTYPLHSSQTYSDDGNQTIFHLLIHITHDFVMELLSHGEEIEVLEPADLKKELCDRASGVLGLYHSTQPPAPQPSAEP